jgi:hypothetical protein
MLPASLSSNRSLVEVRVFAKMGEKPEVIDSRGRRTLPSGVPDFDLSRLLGEFFPGFDSPAVQFVHSPISRRPNRYLRVTDTDALLAVRADGACASIVVPQQALVSRIPSLIELLTL